MPRVYLDWAATAPPDREILQAALDAALACPGNPSSLHEEGRAARARFEEARSTLAAALGVGAGTVTFTSGGTEADAIPVLSLLRKPKPGSIVVTALEHPAVWEQVHALAKSGWKVKAIRPGADGIVDPDAVLNAVEPDTELVACMAVNNETGAIQPIAEIAERIAGLSGKRPKLLCDAVQAFGKIPFDPAKLKLDYASVSAHKLGGPRGAGALYARTPPDAFLVGGGQERGVRPGTESLQGAAGLSLAAAKAIANLDAKLERARLLASDFIRGLRDVPGAAIVPSCRADFDERYSPWIVSFALPGLAAETAVRLMSDAGFAISAGSACSSAKKERRVLDAMGLPRDLSFAALRVSIGPSSTREELEGALAALDGLYRRYKT